MTEQAAEAEAGQRRDFAHDVRGAGRMRIDPAAMEADVDLDQHVDLAARVRECAGPRARDIEVVDDERETHAIGERHRPPRVDWMNGIREPDVLDPGVGERLRFAELRAADPDRPARDLPPRDRRRLVRLRMRPQPLPLRIARRLHPIDIPLETGSLDQDGGGRKIAQPHAGDCSGLQGSRVPGF